MLRARLAPETPLASDSDPAVLVVLEVARLGTVEVLEHLHPELAEAAPRPVSALSSPHDRLARIVAD